MTIEQRRSILESYGVGDAGLSDEQVSERRLRYGRNVLPAKRQSKLMLFLRQFQDIMVYILVGAVIVSLAAPAIVHGTIERTEIIDATVIFAIVIINAVLGFFQEWRAENAIALLKQLTAPHVKVRRLAGVSVISSADLVPGDIILVEAGDRICADARLIASSSLDIDESSLTGESLPSSKVVAIHLPAGSDFVSGMLYAGTLVTRGYGEAIVTATGLQSEIGKITSLVLELKAPEPPLQKELKKTGGRIGILVLFLCAFLFVVGILRGMGAMEMFFTAVSLAVAAVPEGLPAIVTVCLAIGVQRMVSKHALIRKLDAIETLGSVTVICADKTGTITENRMTVKHVWLADSTKNKDLLSEIASSCNRAELPDIGDPTETALLHYAKSCGVARLAIEEEEVPFTSEAKYMVTLHKKDGQLVRYLKGAPEVIAALSPEHVRAALISKASEYSALGMRVLAVAQGESGHVLPVGIIAMMDPARAGVDDAIRLAKRAGIRTIMITGDHPATALTVARSIGIETDGVMEGAVISELSEEQLRTALQKTSVFARVKPVHKVRILEVLQRMGEVVAMSGDGVNDAPALKRANVGVGMGMNGTDVAREAAAMVLTDDNYATIVEAIAEGRRIYDNIKKFVMFLMRSNLGEVFIIAGAMALSMPLPLLPLHILWVNLVTDSFPALALAAEPAEPDIMTRSPRGKNEGIFTGEWTLLLLAGGLNAILALTVFGFALLQSPDNLPLARTAALTTTIVYQMFLALSTRTKSVFSVSSLLTNSLLVLAVLVSLLCHFLLLVTPLGSFFQVVPLPLVLWEEIFGGALLAFVLFETGKWLSRRTKRSV